MGNTTFLVEPEIRKLAHGDWMATTSAATRLRIGVVGTSEDEARARFKASLGRWKEISESEEQ